MCLTYLILISFNLILLFNLNTSFCSKSENLSLVNLFIHYYLFTNYLYQFIRKTIQFNSFLFALLHLKHFFTFTH